MYLILRALIKKGFLNVFSLSFGHTVDQKLALHRESQKVKLRVRTSRPGVESSLCLQQGFPCNMSI